MATNLIRERGLSTIQARLEDIQALSLADESFDVVVSCETLEHVPNPQRAIKELARVLRPDGRMFLTTPNYMVSSVYTVFIGGSQGGVWDEEGASRSTA